ncbi:MAG: hypothetical protein ACRECP_11805, partial [Methylocella sp.]
GFADKLDNYIMYDSIREEWVDQARRQVQASGGRAIEWYFAEEAAAEEAEDIFAEDDLLKGKIKIIHVPALVQ